VVQGPKMVQLVDMFALPEMTLYANVIQVSVHYIPLNVYLVKLCIYVVYQYIFC